MPDKKINRYLARLRSLSNLSFVFTKEKFYVLAESLVNYAGERFDFIVNMNQEVNNYWIRFRGLMDCDERFLSAYQAAILRYENAEEIDPDGEISYERPPSYLPGSVISYINLINYVTLKRKLIALS